MAETIPYPKAVKSTRFSCIAGMVDLAGPLRELTRRNEDAPFEAQYLQRLAGRTESHHLRLRIVNTPEGLPPGFALSDCNAGHFPFLSEHLTGRLPPQPAGLFRPTVVVNLPIPLTELARAQHRPANEL